MKLFDRVGFVAGIIGLGQAVLMVAGGSPFTPSYIQGIGVMGGVLIVMSGVIIRNQRELKQIMTNDECDKP